MQFQPMYYDGRFIKPPPHYLGMDSCANSSVCHFVSAAVEGRVREL